MEDKRSKSIEEREEEYHKARERIFNQDVSFSYCWGGSSRPVKLTQSNCSFNYMNTPVINNKRMQCLCSTIILLGQNHENYPEEFEVQNVTLYLYVLGVRK